MQLVYFRGQGECRASRFVSQGAGLAELMARISVRGGITQWRKVLVHARDEAKAAQVGALVCVGDAMEEDQEGLLALAGELALSGVKAFMFQEGDDKRARPTFQEIARLTGGAYGAFDAGAAARLATLAARRGRLRRRRAATRSPRSPTREAEARPLLRRCAASRCRNSSPACCALYFLLMAIRWFGRVTPASAAKIVRGGGYAIGVAAMLALLLRGSFGLVGMLASLMFANVLRGGGNPFAAVLGAAGWGGSGSRESVARSAAIEMRLDRDSGRMRGEVSPGRSRDVCSRQMTRARLPGGLRYCQSDDPEGAALLEAYLDRRFSAWRQAQQGDGDARTGGWSGGALTRDEAYEILGLAKGASREEIVAAHRSLMKKLHPDHGGSTALAARVNQAKDVLLG